MADSVLVTVGTIKKWKTVLYGLFHTNRWLVKDCKDYCSFCSGARGWVPEWESPSENGQVQVALLPLLSSHVSQGVLHWTTDWARMLPMDRASPALLENSDPSNSSAFSFLPLTSFFAPTPTNILSLLLSFKGNFCMSSGPSSIPLWGQRPLCF